MSGNKKRKKKHRPMAVLQLGGLSVIADRERTARAKIPLSDERQLAVCISYHQSIDALATGRAKQCDLDTLIYALNIGTLLAEKAPELGSDHLDLLADASAGIQRSKERFLEGKGLGLDDDALVAVKKAYDLHEAQMRVATTGELEDAIDEMHRRVAAEMAEELKAA